MAFENEQIEWKRDYTDSLPKEVTAFANTSGGKIYIGVDDSGNFIGLDNIDETYLKITNSLRDAIAPDITMFLKYTLINNVVCIEISEGTCKPYYIKSKGMKPSGVYVRQGASSVPATPEQIRSMIKLSDGDVFESARSPTQELTFRAAENVFAEHNIPFDESKFVQLGIRSLKDGQYTNLGKIVSDECEHTVKAAVFADENNTVFRAHREFSGSVFVQLADAFDYLMLCNRNKSEFVGVERIDKWDYPSEAVREALLNALVHRDYSFSGSIIINVNDSFMEIISLGGLVGGLTNEDIKNGVSQPRNRMLAEMFHRLNYIESYGTGIRRIYALYSGCPLQPKIEITANSFKITLPNMNKACKKAKNSAHSPQTETVIRYLKTNGEISDSQLRELLGIKKTRAYTLEKQMCDAKIIRAEGRGENKRFFLNL